MYRKVIKKAVKRKVLKRMKKLSVLALLVLTSSTLLFGCGKTEEPVSEEPVAEEAAEDTAPEEEEPSPVEEENPWADDETAPEGMVRSQLTNEFIPKEVAEKRPAAVMINNIINAIPQSGISQAGVIYECVVEGSLTRMMAVFENWEEIPKIGPVRSCRDYYVYWAYEWDAIYCHFGGPKLYVNAVLSREDTNNLDGTSLDGTVYFRTTDRKAPHNAYASGSGIAKGVELKGYSLTHTENYREGHYFFTPASKQNDLSQVSGVFDATYLAPGYLINKPYFEYNAEDGLYYRYQYDRAHIDTENGEQLAFKNVIFQNTYYETRDDHGYLAFQDHDNTRDGYYFTNGKGIHVRWKKSSDYSPTRYYDDDGNEIVLNTGKTFVCIVQDQKSDAVVVKDADGKITVGDEAAGSSEEAPAAGDDSEDEE